MFGRVGSSFVRASKVTMPVRHMGGASASGSAHGYKPKTLYEAWCSDSGAYPVMGVIVFACIFSVGTGLYFMGTHQDSRVSKGSRKALFRGELKNIQ